LSSLPELLAVSAGNQPYLPMPLQVPSPAMLPAQERRRSSTAVRLVLACIDQALRDWPLPADGLRSVFATDEGTGEVCQQMLAALATTRQVSPLLFSNSVLNAPSGYFSIAWRNRQPSSVVSLGLESFASGLLCAVCDAQASGQPVLLVACDPPMPSPLDELLPVHEGTATAWIVSTAPPVGAPALATFSVAMLHEPGLLPSPFPAWMPPAWAAHSSTRGLAALGLLAQDTGAELRLQLGAGLLALRRDPGEGR
jgi:hypothetical protein